MLPSVGLISTISYKQYQANDIFIQRLCSQIPLQQISYQTKLEALKNIYFIPSKIQNKIISSLQNFIYNLNNIHIQDQLIQTNQQSSKNNKHLSSNNINSIHLQKHNINNFHKPNIQITQINNNIKSQKHTKLNQNKQHQQTKKIEDNKNLKYYQNKLKSYQNQNHFNNPQFQQNSKKQQYMKSQTKLNKSSTNKQEKSNLSKNYQKMLKISKIDPQLYEKNLEKKKKQAQDKFMSNIQFLNRIKGINEVKTLPKQWKQQIKINYKQARNKNRHKIQEIGFTNIPSRKYTNYPSNSLILPKIQKSPKKYELDKPISFNLYNINRKPNQIYSLK